MNLSINAEYLLRTRTWGCNRTRDESIKLCVDAGFNVLDCSANVWEDDWERDVDAIMNAAAKYGAVIEQSHAPFNFY